MNDVKDMLAAALDRGPGPGQPVNPAGDLARGRRLLRRRRLTGLAGAAGVAAVAAGHHDRGADPRPGGPGAPHPAPAAGQHTRHQHAPRARPPPGQAGHQAGVLPGLPGPGLPGLRGAPRLGRAGQQRVRADRRPGRRPGQVRRLVRRQDRGDAEVPRRAGPEGPAQPAGGRPCPASSTGRADTWILLYQDPSGQWVDIQFPAKLGWDAPQFARFAAGVKVLGNAQPGRG